MLAFYREMVHMYQHTDLHVLNPACRFVSQMEICICLLAASFSAYHSARKSKCSFLLSKWRRSSLCHRIRRILWMRQAVNTIQWMRSSADTSSPLFTIPKPEVENLYAAEDMDVYTEVRLGFYAFRGALKKCSEPPGVAGGCHV